MIQPKIQEVYIGTNKETDFYLVKHTWKKDTALFNLKEQKLITFTPEEFETFKREFGKELLELAADNAKLLPFNGDYDVHETDKSSITSVLDEFLKKI